MENFVVSARKYRPALFNSVVGQSSITTTLKNAIRNNHLAQAFLFCGPRGVGKTTCARILAKTINCTNLTPETEACNECESCTSFNTGQSFNVYELDAASNNSVDDIRSLVDQVRVPPQMGQYKVYIIDEVHMLSAAAFNAFLKTLEEPPRYAIFILATTERHKILPTILSRCQIFNFNRIQVDDIAGHLAYIAKNENVQAEPDALHIIAQKADGALRDACSIFDQVVSFAGNNLTYKAVIENLNVLDYDYYFRVTDFVLADNIPGSLLTFNDILTNGFDGHNFIAGLAEHLRNLLVCKDPQTLLLLEAGQNIRERYRDQASRCQTMFLLRALKLVNGCDVGYKSARNPRLLVEFTLMQLCALNGAAEKKNDELNENSSSDPAPQPSANAQSSSATTNTQQPVSNTPQAPTPQPVSTANVQQPVSTTSGVGQLRKNTTLKSTGGSISSFTNPQQNTTTTAAETAAAIDRPSTPFAQEQLETAWTAFADQLRAAGKVTDHAALTMNRPEKTGDNAVRFTVFNAMALERLEADKTELMTFLRQKLNNYHFTLEIALSKEEGQQRLYTPQDKFRRLAELNPDLQKLRQQFDLDLEM
ncbi:MAG: DNA polymerase III subunit gamma/tau [Bacteroidia bacterium]|jgi:DNA polymerase-3 subunit gamma/tau|nr:DNA polymerase III subunit gamma/tau [Bacteroidia bacterium]